MPAIKNEQRFGKVPRLTVRHADGTETHIWESRAIYDYVASELGFLPSNPLARADVNSLVFSLTRSLTSLPAMPIETVEARTAYLAKLRDIKIPEILEYHEKYLMEKKSAGPYYGGQKILLPDVLLYTIWLRLVMIFDDNYISAQRWPHLARIIDACETGRPGEIARSWDAQFDGRYGTSLTNSRISEFDFFTRRLMYNAEQAKWVL
ncbi:hypothetical protein BKA62DRAFT_626085 [Auriculariales sp. MPI-PUGE-AT-0066]|nr:hypothetical protein BKA62DRAFT_626085 [Auriculariales sp. MPI-PUGE-AT-0066]